MRLIDADAFWAQFEEGENKLSFMKSIFPPEIIDVTLKIYAELKERLDSMPVFEPQKWIPVSERLPEERDSIFAKLYGTEKWRNAMFKQSSNTVIVTVEYRDGTRQVAPNHTIDGDWNDSIKGMSNVIAWMPMPKPYKEDLHESKSDNTD